MPRMSASDRKFLIAGGVLLVLFVAAVVLLAPDQEVEEPYPSSYSAKSGGAKATYLLLEQLGYQVERWNSPIHDLPAEAEGVIFVLLSSQREEVSKEETKDLHAFVLRGGTVLAAGAGASNFLAELDAFPSWSQKKSWTHYPAAMPSGLNRGIPEITMPERSRVWMVHEDQVPVFANQDGPAVLQYRQGKGMVIWLGSPAPVTNAGMTLPANVTFLMNCLNVAGAKRILWDTYHSGERHTLTSSLSTPALYWGGGQLIFLALAAMWTFSRRSGPLRAAPEPSRLSPLEFVETLGGLYRRTHAASLTLDVAFRRFATLISRRLGLSSDATPARIAEAAAPFLNRDEATLAALLQECESGRFNPELKSNEAMRLVRELHDILVQMKLIPSNPQEKH